MPSKIQPQTPSPKRLPEPATAGFQDAANPIFNAALEQRVLVNLPAQVFAPLKEWIETNALLELSAEAGIQWIVLFVTDGELDSRNLLRHSLAYFQHQVIHVVVKNHGVVKQPDPSRAWAEFEDDSPLQELMSQYTATIIDFPAFHGDAELIELDKQNLTFREALTYKGFSLISRQRVKNFLRSAYAAFEATEVFRNAGEA
ncbi:MAG: hypothetical protein F6K04_26805 [Leptolyngbya sp. SIO4C5]|nr:hypothetical protein [Leptolyngbya sp. SIO4C5]